MIHLNVRDLLCIMSLTYRKRKAPENPSCKIAASETWYITMIIVTDGQLSFNEEMQVFHM